MLCASTAFYFFPGQHCSFNTRMMRAKNPRPLKGRGLKRTRVTTFVRKQLTLLTSVSVRQHSGAINVRHYVTAYY